VGVNAGRPVGVLTCTSGVQVMPSVELLKAISSY
jgi:hypothetical protein